MAATAVLQRACVLDPPALRRARLDAGLSLRAVGSAISLDFSTVAKHERGEIDTPASVLAALASLYRVDPGSFFMQAAS